MKKRYLIAAIIPLAALVFSACGNDKSPTPKPASIKSTEVPEAPTVLEETTKEPEPQKAPVELDLSEFDPRDFFKDVVYCGDSCMNFYKWEGNSYVNPETFGPLDTKVWLASNSNAVRYAVIDVDDLSSSEKAYIPKFNGEPCNLWKAIPQLEKNRVMMFFGLNDIGPSGVDGFIENYIAVIEKIKDAVPDAKFYILSVTPMREDKQVEGKLCTENINKANVALEKMCAYNGWTYVDVAENLRDENGHLILALPDGTKLSDGTNVHLTKAAYAFWDEALENLAREELRKEYYEGK